MRAFGVVRIVAGVLTLLVNAAFGMFLVLDYLKYGKNVHPECYHGPAVLGVFGPAALAVLLIVLTAFVELVRRHKPAAVTQVRFELAWIGVVVFLQYSAALVYTTLYWFAFKCARNAIAPPFPPPVRPADNTRETCKTLNMTIFIASLAVPFIALVYFVMFLVVAQRAASRDSSQSIWRTPVRDVDWDGRRRTFVYDDARSIASFANKEDPMFTIKTNAAYNIGTLKLSRGDTLKLGNGDTLKLGGGHALRLDTSLTTEPKSLRTLAPRPLEAIYEDQARATFAPPPTQPQPLELQRSSPPVGVKRQSAMTTRSESSVYSTDSPIPQTGPIIPRIIRTSASTMSQSMQSPIKIPQSPMTRSLSKVKYFAATNG